MKFRADSLRSRDIRPGLVALSFVLVSAVSAPGQAPGEAGAEPEGSPTPVAAASPAGANTPEKPATPAGGDTGAALDYLFNRKPQEGSAAKQANEIGKRFDDKAKAAEALGLRRSEDPQTRARFETYLSMGAVPADQLKTYDSAREQVQALLRTDRVFDAWKQLHQLASFKSIDAGVSQELANRIEAIWNSGRATGRLDQRNQNLQNEIKRSNRNADLMSDGIREQEIKYRRKESEGRSGGKSGKKAPNGGVPSAGDPTGGAVSAPSIAGIEGRLQLTEEYLQSLEAKAKIKLNELKAEKLLEQAKADFGEYIGTLYSSGRYTHVILSADFYRKIFNESEYPVAIANQVNASLERARDVKAAVEVFRYKIGRQELASATDRLQEAFMASEFHPAVLGLDRDLKEKAADFLAKLGQMQNLIEARDFTALETMLRETKEMASDFDISKPMALVNAVKLESRLRMGKAKLAAQTGDLKTAMEEFQAAAEAWPANPALEENAGTFFTTQDVKTQSVTEFDRLLNDANYRAIFDKQLAFAPAIHGDAKREEALKDALLKIKDAEIAAEKASALVMNGDAVGAWEAIELAAANLPDDKKLNKLRADLSGRSAEFVSTINKAKEAEAKQELGYSLTWYVNAQRQYPPSRLANEGIERLTRELLGEGEEKAF